MPSIHQLLQGHEHGYVVYLPLQYGRHCLSGDWDEANRVHPFDDRQEMNASATLSKEQYVSLVNQAIKTIQETEINKIVTSRKVPIKGDDSDWPSWWERWLDLFPQAFIFCMHHPQWGIWMGASPELLLYTRQGQIQTMALAGSKSIEDDSHWTAKERAEHEVVSQMLSETLHRNGVSDIHQNVTQEIRFSKVKHLQTLFSGHFKGDFSQLVQSLHPTPALCGWPVESSRRWLAQHEGYNRELYGGCMELSYRQERWAFVILRCIQIQRDQSFAYVGGGIMSNSDPEVEWNETMWKLKSYIFAADENIG